MSYVQGLSMVILMVPDVQQAVEFYQFLGLKLQFHIKNAWAEFDLGSTKLGICATSQHISDRRTGLVFEVADIQRVYAELQDKIEFIQPPREAIHGIMATFKDPGGNIIDLYQPTPEKVKELVEKVVKEDKDVTEN